jgi:general secretion pathway protein H
VNVVSDTVFPRRTKKWCQTPFFRAAPRSGVRHRLRAPADAGFTLVELLVVLVIAVAVATVSIPLFSKLLARAELRGTASDLATLLRYTRGQAIARRRETSVRCELDTRRCRVPQLDKVYTLAQGLEVKLVTADLGGSDERAGEVRFFPDGTSSGGEITLSRAGNGYAIRVEWLTGHVSVSKHHEGDDD